MNNNGPSTDPCGTPLNTSSHSIIVSPITTLCRRFFKKLDSHLSRSSPKPYARAFPTSSSCGTVSNALAKSKRIKMTKYPLLIASVMVSNVSKRLVVHAFPGTKPCCPLYMRLFSIKCSFQCCLQPLPHYEPSSLSVVRFLYSEGYC